MGRVKNLDLLSAKQQEDGAELRNPNSYTRFTNYGYGDQVNENEIPVTHSKQREEICIFNFSQKSWRKETIWET
jgi:hypothetical protein